MLSFWRNVCRIRSNVSGGGYLQCRNSNFSSTSCKELSTSECSSGVGGEIISFSQRLRSNGVTRETGFFFQRGIQGFVKRPSWISVPSRNLATSDYNPPKLTLDEDGSAAINTEELRPIKFKRLDKTARHIMTILDKEEVEKVRGSREIPEIKPGYIVQLKVEVPENKSRVSVLKGIVIARRNAGLHTTIRLRRTVAGVGVESVFPLYSPNIKEMKVLDKKDVRRAKLYYLRDRMNSLKRNK
ncbi:large ribosomal subunit protein bL19c-like [Wolffia australiana]